MVKVMEGAKKRQMKGRREGHCDKKCISLIPASQQFKPNASCENRKMSENEEERKETQVVEIRGIPVLQY